MKRWRIGLIGSMVITLLGAGCSDDGTTPGDDRLRVTITAVDGDGQPVPGLDLAMASYNDYLQDFAADEPGPEKARIGIQFAIAAPGRVTVLIRDIEGDPVRTLVSEDLPADQYLYQWDGKDDEGEHQMSGRYTVHMTQHDAGNVLVYEETVDILMALLSRYMVGTTDAGGRITLTDRRLFPHLYDREPMTATDEGGTEMGLLELDETMIFNFYSQEPELSQWFTGDVAGSGNLQFVWDPEEKTTADTTTGERPAPAIVPIPGAPYLRAYPSPFN